MSTSDVEPLILFPRCSVHSPYRRSSLMRLCVLRTIAALAFAPLILLPSRPAQAGRCSTGLVSGGFHCGVCPDPTTLPNPCGPGEDLVIYDLDKPFGFDGTTMSGVT